MDSDRVRATADRQTDELYVILSKAVRSYVEKNKREMILNAAIGACASVTADLLSLVREADLKEEIKGQIVRILDEGGSFGHMADKTQNIVLQGKH